jgi:beta-glucanase (GH16 family)
MPSFLFSITTLVSALALGGISASAADAGAAPPMPLIDFSSPDAAKQASFDKGVPAGSTVTVDKTGVVVNFSPFQPGDADHPGVLIVPAAAKTWDLSGYGHVEAKITDTGDRGFSLIMRVVDDKGSFWRIGPRVEGLDFKPGETKIFKVVLGHDNFHVTDYANSRGRFGPRAGAVPHQAKIARIDIFLYHSTEPHSIRIEDLKAAGPAGESPGSYADIDPGSVVTTPANGVILGQGAAFDPAKQIEGGKASAGPGGALAINYTGGKVETIKVKPVVGVWNLGRANEVRVKFKNSGQTAVTPAVTIGPNTATAKDPIAPGAEAEVVVSFLPPVTPVIAADPSQSVVGPGKWEAVNWTPQKGTGTDFESNSVKNLSITSDNSPGSKSLLVTSITADTAVDDVPDWLGKKPPSDGDWTQTLDEEFNGPTLDPKTWNVHGDNPWDKWTHFSQDNVILKDGKVLLHYEKKSGFHNDDPKDSAIGKTDYASGCLNSYGKWTQKYGYFEARMKLPTAPGLWATFCLLPDRGAAAGSVRTSTSKESVDGGAGGMEFDIMDFLSGWGPYRYNIVSHWDGYLKTHKSAGSPNIYIRSDKDGYITPGLLWTPGSVIMYNDGKEVFRWQSARVGDVPCYLMCDLVSGGWSIRDVCVNSRLDDAKLPDDFTIDYVRAWQRKDLAAASAAPKP